MESHELQKLRSLAENDYPGFVRYRQELIDRAIAASGRRAPQLRQLQEQIDALRALAGTPEKALGELLGMMQERLENMNLWLDRLTEEVRHLQALAPDGASEPAKSAL